MAVRQVLLFHITLTLLNARSHPNIAQLCGSVSSGNIHATIFHDSAIYNFLNGDTEKFKADLIPVRQFMELHRHSHTSNVYIYAYTVCTCRFLLAKCLIYARK
jgi:hypothetical protein